MKSVKLYMNVQKNNQKKTSLLFAMRSFFLVYFGFI